METNIVPFFKDWLETETMDCKKKEDKKPHGLVDLIFSWSITDIMNKNLFQDKVQRIPETFTSTGQFLNSFVNPLLEETRADLESNLLAVSNAPACKIKGVYNVEKDPDIKIYTVLLKRGGTYKPEGGDLIALTEVKPRRIDDLDRPRRPYSVAFVEEVAEKEFKDDIGSFKILSSKHVMFEEPDEDNGIEGDTLFVVYLSNLITNIRIWNALHPDIDGANMKILNSVLRSNPSLEDDCTFCSSNEDESVNISKARDALSPLGLDESQKAAVLSVIATTECCHQNSVKLIWGPPGTGKTKTIASLLFSLFGMKCKTLTCAPTNVAVAGVAKRLMSLIGSKLMYERYGLGDIVLFGNRERMKINDHEELFDVFLDNRVRVLKDCFAVKTGWTASLEYMICLLEDPQGQYLQYVKKKTDEHEKNCVKDDDDEEELKEAENENEPGKCEWNFWKGVIIRNLKESKKKNKKGNMFDKTQPVRDNNLILWTVEEFLVKTFRSLGQTLTSCIVGFCTHMPTVCLSEEAVKCMVEVSEMIRVLISLMAKFDASFEGFMEAIEGNEEAEYSGGVSTLRQMRIQFLEILRLLRGTFSVPEVTGKSGIRLFCLQNASLIFCTASSSAKLNSVELVIIDEAAQLKECESCIPLQIPGLRNAILVGDEKQLRAMVQSKICDKADFGRSLFERLVILGYREHLLNVQYRMHPSISLFPNKEFYNNGIANGENVTERGYERRFLKGDMFGPYSFIDINNGKEEFQDGFSPKNTVEAFVVAETVSQLYKECALSNRKVCVGCISPYKGQISAIKERLGNTYSTDVNDTFSVNVRSVDGFQGGEEDIIIISTVRCNGRGSVGFLSNFQRVNVALTRARYCCWVLGNAATLLNSGSVWKKLVLDAKSRDCFHNAGENKSLALAISNALAISGGLSSLFCTDSILFKMSKWKISFSKQFHDSIMKLDDSRILETIKTLLFKLSNGWRENVKDGSIVKSDGPSSKLMECYDVTESLKLIWSIGIHSESSREFQVIKIWDIVPRTEVLKTASALDVMFGSYSWNYMNSCLYRLTEGDLTLPMTWPVDGKATSSNPGNDSSHELAHRLAATKLDDHGPRSYANRSNRGRW